MKRKVNQIIQSETLNVNEKVDKLLELIIDGLNPLFKPVSDEIMELSEETYGIFSRVFKNKVTKEEKKLTWKVTYGTPETVKVEFI